MFIFTEIYSYATIFRFNYSQAMISFQAAYAYVDCYSTRTTDFFFTSMNYLSTMPPTVIPEQLSMDFESLEDAIHCFIIDRGESCSFFKGTKSGSSNSMSDLVN
jgi:hypothetical protein